MSNYILTLPLKTEKWQEDRINRSLRLMEILQHRMIRVRLRQKNNMEQTKTYKKLMRKLGTNKEKNKKIWKQANLLRKEYGFCGAYSFFKEYQSFQKYWSNYLPENCCAVLNQTVNRAFDKLFFDKKTKNIHFYRKGELNFIRAGRSNSAIIVKDGYLKFLKMKIPMILNLNDYYQNVAFKNKICYAGIKRVYIKGKAKYFAQITFEGDVPKKYNKMGEERHPLGSGRIGIDIGTSTVAITRINSKDKKHNCCKLVPLADSVKDYSAEERRLLRALDRSRIANNPENYNDNGTIAKHGNKKLIWKKSKNYIKLERKLADCRRRQAIVRKEDHRKLANSIVEIGDEVFVEKMEFSGLSRRAKNTEISEKTGKFKRKARFGKSIGNRAPAMFIDILNNKEKELGGTLNKINTQKMKASQYDSQNDTYKKHCLSTRVVTVGQDRIQRDLNASYNLMCSNATGNEVDKKIAKLNYSTFKKLHDAEMQRLEKEDKKHLKSMGV